jgi:diguanylate cyclase (GGDEF)-like protein
VDEDGHAGHGTAADGAAATGRAGVRRTSPLTAGPVVAGLLAVALAVVAASEVVWRSGAGSLVAPVAGVVAATVGVGLARRRRPIARSRWCRGWWAVAIAPAVLGATVAPGVVDSAWRPLLAVAAASLILLGLVGAVSAPDGAARREALVEAGLAGGTAAYLLGVVAVTLGAPLAVEGAGLGPHLAALAAEVAAIWLVVGHVLRDRTASTTGDRWLVAALVTLALGRTALVIDVTTGTSLAAALPLRAGAVSAVAVLLAVAVSRPGVAEEPSTGRGARRAPSPGAIAVVLAAALAGPVLVVATVAGDAVGTVGPDLATVALTGGVLALLAVMHLLQLVRDHGRRAWRARHDALTELPTEPLFLDRLHQAVARARRTDRGVAVAFVDLDDFKRINDRDGHDAGDAVLRHVAGRMQGALRDHDTVARRSGDEFLVLLPDVDRPEDVEVVVTRLLGEVTRPIASPAGTQRVGASIGLALWPRDGREVDDLLRHADAAMYEAKQEPGGPPRWYRETTTARTRLRLTLAQQLEAALEDAERFEVAFQPRVDLVDGHLEALVALARWRHPELGLLTPQVFLPIAAEAGLTRQLDLAVLRRATCTVAGWRAAGHLDVPVVVHIADPHATHPELADDVREALAAAGLPADRLQLEVGETAVGRGGERTAATIRTLADEGTTTILGGFGTGAVSLGRLAATPLAAVELAADHVSSVAEHPAPVVDAALAVASRLGLAAAANGITSSAQAARLRAAGCRAGRGPGLVPPAAAEPLARVLAELATRDDHDPRRVPAAALASAAAGDLHRLDRPELAQLVRASVGGDGGVDTEVQVRTLTDVLEALEGTSTATSTAGPSHG